MVIQTVLETIVTFHWAPRLWCSKNLFLNFFFQFYVNKKYAKVVINDFKRTYKTEMETEGKNNVTKRPSSKRRNCLRKHFHSFNRAFQEEKRFCIWHELRNKTAGHLCTLNPSMGSA